MTESEFVRKFMMKIRKAYPWLVAFRHEDVRTAGIPDISLTRIQGSGTLWLEAKRLPGAKFPQLQRNNLKKCGGFYIVWNDELQLVSIWNPDKKPDLAHFYQWVPIEKAVEFVGKWFSEYKTQLPPRYNRD